MSDQYPHQMGPNRQQYGQPQETGGRRSTGDPVGQQAGGQQSMQGGQQPVQGGQQMGQPMEGRSMQGGQTTQAGGRVTSFEDHLTNELRILLEDFSEVTHVAEWCAKECAYAGPELATCARVCEDVAEIAELNEKLIARDSPFGPQVADLFVRVATQGLPELQRHAQHHPHVLETIATIERTINSCSALLESGGGQQIGGQPTQGGERMGGQQPVEGGQRMGGQPMRSGQQPMQGGGRMGGQGGQTGGTQGPGGY